MLFIPILILLILVNAYFSAAEIASALAEMRASGDYDDEVARGAAMRGDDTADAN